MKERYARSGTEMPTKSKAWYGNTIKAHSAPTKIICDAREWRTETELAHGAIRFERSDSLELRIWAKLGFS
jgi:hypothetical protein